MSIKEHAVNVIIKIRSRTASILLEAIEHPKRYVIYACLIASVFFSFFSNYGIITRIRLEIETYRIDKKISRASSQEIILDSLIKKAGDLDEIERIAREEYNFSLEGETVYSIKK